MTGCGWAGKTVKLKIIKFLSITCNKKSTHNDISLIVEIIFAKINFFILELFDKYYTEVN